MNTKKLLSGLDILQVVNNIPQQIQGIYVNSKEVKKDGLFVCIDGTKSDGHNFAKESVKNGATAVVCQKLLDVDVCQILVADSHKAISQLATAWYGCPSKKLKVICVAGTNGKTSTAYLIYKILTFFNYLFQIYLLK